MELYLQFAYGMKQMTLDLSDEWESTSVILSPRDITPKQLITWGKDFRKSHINCLFDPQCYYPKCDHKNLIQYEYWNSNLNTQLGNKSSIESELIKKLYNYNKVISAKKFIIPAIMRPYNNDWFSLWKRDNVRFLNETNTIVKEMDKLLTIVLPADLLCQSEDVIENIIEETSKWDIDGYYIVPEPYKGQYLVEHPVWMTNLMQLCAGLKLQERMVIVGYANQQFLSLSAAKIDAIASGTYLNVRRFSNKFQKIEDIKRRSVWYYYPNSLSEYKIVYLDAAFNNGVLNEMRPSREMDNEYISLLFSGVRPTTTEFNETLAFKHYLQCLKMQVELCTRPTFKETIEANEILLTTSERRIEFLEKYGVYSGRSFKEIVDVNRSALQRLQRTRHFLMEQMWETL